MLKSLPQDKSLKLVQHMLKDTSNEIKPALNILFKESIDLNYLEIIKVLLQDKRIDPSNHNNSAIGCASENGHIEIVKLLLQDPRVDPSASDNFAIKTALRFNHLEIVKLLIPKIDISKITNNKIL